MAAPFRFVRRLMRRFAVACGASSLLALTGVAATAEFAGPSPVIRSERFVDPEGFPDQELARQAADQGCGSPLFVRHVGRLMCHLPWVGHKLRAKQLQPYPLQPPPSRFHPVPTRPVFEPRWEYAPPEPVNVHATRHRITPAG